MKQVKTYIIIIITLLNARRSYRPTFTPSAAYGDSSVLQRHSSPRAAALPGCRAKDRQTSTAPARGVAALAARNTIFSAARMLIAQVHRVQTRSGRTQPPSRCSLGGAGRRHGGVRRCAADLPRSTVRTGRGRLAWRALRAFAVNRVYRAQLPSFCAPRPLSPSCAAVTFLFFGPRSTERVQSCFLPSFAQETAGDPRACSIPPYAFLFT